MKLFLSLTIVFFLLLGCSENKKTKSDKYSNTSFLVSDTIIFNIDTTTSTECNAWQYYIDKKLKKEYFVYYDKVCKKITFIDLSSKKVDLKIKINSDGKDAIPYFTGFRIKNLDSIYIFSGGYRIFRINSNGEILNTIKYDTLISDYGIGLLSSLSKYHTNALIVGNNMFLIQLDANYYYEDITNPTLYHFCYKMDLNNLTIKSMSIHHPENFWQNGVKELLVSWDYNNKSFVYSPLYSHDIYISNDNNGINKTFNVPSKYITSLIRYNPNIVPSQNEYFENRLTYQRYLGIIYDRYKELYYRFFWPGMDITNMTDKELIDAYINLKTFGITVLDKDFNIIDEIILPENIYSLKYFVSYRGLAISADSPKNNNSKENEWEFHIFNLNQILQTDNKEILFR